MFRKLAISLIAIAAAVGAPQAYAGDPSTGVSTASQALSAAGGEVVSGSAGALAGSGKVAVAALAVGGESAILVLRGASTGAEASVKVSAETVQAAGLAVGAAVSVVQETAGLALTAGGTLLAFLPNDDTRDLLHSAVLR